MKARNELNARLYEQKMNGLTLTDYFSEHAKYSSVCNGNIENVRAKIEDGSLSLNQNLRILSDNKLKNTIYHFVLTASSIAEACMDGGMGQTEAYTLSDLYILKADKSKNIVEIKELYAQMCLDFAERMKEIHKEPVISLHIRRCINYIYENLGNNLSVKAISKEMKLNPTYLSRLFFQEKGIPLKQFVKEARVDTSQNLLRYSDLPYLKISVSLGFSSQSSFISVFKEITGMTPKAFRDQNYMVKAR